MNKVFKVICPGCETELIKPKDFSREVCVEYDLYDNPISGEPYHKDYICRHCGQELTTEWISIDELDYIINLHSIVQQGIREGKKQIDN